MIENNIEFIFQFEDEDSPLSMITVNPHLKDVPDYALKTIIFLIGRHLASTQGLEQAIKEVEDAMYGKITEGFSLQILSQTTRPPGEQGGE